MKKTILAVIALLTFSLTAPALVPAFADCPTSGATTTAKSQVLNGLGDTGGDCSGSGVNSLLSTVVSVISTIAGAAAIIMILLSGFRYITSGGDSGRVGSAKNTLIYALVGVAIAASAQLLVHFVLNQSNEAAVANQPCTSNTKILGASDECTATHPCPTDSTKPIGDKHCKP